MIAFCDHIWKGFCEEVLLAAWVFKPRLTKHSSVIVIILVCQELVFFGDWVKPILWWQQALRCTRLEELCLLRAVKRAEAQIPPHLVAAVGLAS